MKKYSEIKHDCTIPESEAYELGKDAQHQQDLRDFVEWLETDCTEHPKVSDSYGIPYFDSHSDCVECLESLKQLVEEK